MTSPDDGGSAIWWGVPGDATFLSLLVGASLGLGFSFASLVALTHSPAQWADSAARAWAHAPALHLALALALAALMLHFGGTTLRKHVALKAEVGPHTRRSSGGCGKISAESDTNLTSLLPCAMRTVVCATGAPRCPQTQHCASAGKISKR